MAVETSELPPGPEFPGVRGAADATGETDAPAEDQERVHRRWRLTKGVSPSRWPPPPPPRWPYVLVPAGRPGALPGIRPLGLCR